MFVVPRCFFLWRFGGAEPFRVARNSRQGRVSSVVEGEYGTGSRVSSCVSIQRYLMSVECVDSWMSCGVCSCTSMPVLRPFDTCGLGYAKSTLSSLVVLCKAAPLGALFRVAPSGLSVCCACRIWTGLALVALVRLFAGAVWFRCMTLNRVASPLLCDLSPGLLVGVSPSSAFGTIPRHFHSHYFRFVFSYLEQTDTTEPKNIALKFAV